MNQTERLQRLLESLWFRRHDTYDNLALEFHVSKSTIRRDIAILTHDYPLITVSGRYRGGVWVEEGYYLSHRMILSPDEMDVLRNVRDESDGDRRKALSSILVKLAP